MPHNHLKDLSSSFELHAKCSYQDSTGTKQFTPLDVLWESTGDPDWPSIATIRINKGAGIPGQTWVLGLYTIGIQGREWKVYLDATDANFAILEPNETPRPPEDGKYEIPKTGVVGDRNPKKRPPNEENILFIRFTGGAVVVKAKSMRRRHVKTKFTVDEHDTAPPPPDPGGEEGDGEEEE